MGGGEEKRRQRLSLVGTWIMDPRHKISPTAKGGALLGESDKAQWRHQLGPDRDGGAGLQSNP